MVDGGPYSVLDYVVMIDVLYFFFSFQYEPNNIYLNFYNYTHVNDTHVSETTHIINYHRRMYNDIFLRKHTHITNIYT